MFYAMFLDESKAAANLQLYLQPIDPSGKVNWIYGLALATEMLSYWTGTVSAEGKVGKVAGAESATLLRMAPRVGTLKVDRARWRARKAPPCWFVAEVEWRIGVTWAS